MEVTVVNKTKNELEFEIHGASETLLGPLMNHTLANSNVEYASYYMGHICLLYTSPSPRDLSTSRMPSSA